MDRILFALAFHVYVLGALASSGYLIRPWRGLAWAARLAAAAGLLLQAGGLGLLLHHQHGQLEGLGQGVAVVSFLWLAISLAVDLIYRVPVLGAFLTPMALAVWAPGLWWPGSSGGVPLAVRQPLLPLHVSVALMGVAAFAAAAGVGLVYLLMERQMKGKQFGLLFSRLPSLQVLDELNRRLVVAGFVALSLTLVTGAFFASAAGPFWAWQSKEVGTLVAWGVFAALLTARLFAGWRGRRVALLTMAGFCIVLVCLFASYGVQERLGGLR